MVELRLIADAGSTEPLADALLAAGALSVGIEDADAESADEAPLYGEPGLAPARHAWARSRLRVLWDGSAAAAESALARTCRELGVAPPAVEGVSVVGDTDWVRASQAQFAPTRVGRLWIVPSWHTAPPESPESIVLRLDPGVAFGTGTHPTTQLCLAWLDAHLPRGARVLDYGCGSGILAIAAGRLGAGALVGVDLDPQALEAARANSASNGVSARYTEPASLGAGTYDIVVANILSNPLKLLAPALLARVAPRGALVLSGVLERQADDVLAVYRGSDTGFHWQVWRALDGWACLAGRRDQ